MGMGWRERIGVGVWGVRVGYSQPPTPPPYSIKRADLGSGWGAASAFDL